MGIVSSSRLAIVKLNFLLKSGFCNLLAINLPIVTHTKAHGIDTVLNNKMLRKAEDQNNSPESVKAELAVNNIAQDLGLII